MSSYLNVVGVQFRRAGRIYFYSLREKMSVLLGDKVVVDTERGLSLGEVVSLRYSKSDKRMKPVVRKATHHDPKQRSKNTNKRPRLSNEEMYEFVSTTVRGLELRMSILKVEPQFGGNKVLIYFSAPGRVDFRKLVKELAHGLQLRIELKQVGPRNEAKLLGGIGICGQEYCCSSFLREFLPLSTKMARNQNLALNPSKVSGGCGRLLCCLRYENDTYSALRKKLPSSGDKITIVGEADIDEDKNHGVVIKTDLLNESLLVEMSDGDRVVIKAEKVKKMTQVQDGAEALAEEWGEDLDLEELLD